MEKNWILNYINLQNVNKYNNNFISNIIDKYDFINNNQNNKSTSLIDYEKILESINKKNDLELYSDFKALELLEIQKNITDFLQNYVSNKYLNYNILLNSLNKLFFISGILAKQLNLPDIKNKKK